MVLNFPDFRIFGIVDIFEFFEIVVFEFFEIFGIFHFVFLAFFHFSCETNRFFCSDNYSVALPTRPRLHPRHQRKLRLCTRLCGRYLRRMCAVPRGRRLQDRRNRSLRVRAGARLHPRRTRPMRVPRGTWLPNHATWRMHHRTTAAGLHIGRRVRRPPILHARDENVRGCVRAQGVRHQCTVQCHQPSGHLPVHHRLHGNSGNSVQYVFFYFRSF